MTLFDVELPDGWTAEPYYDGFAIIAPSIGYATISLAQRVFRGGMTMTGKPIGATARDRYAAAKKYRGRGWRAALVKDAIAWLGKL